MIYSGTLIGYQKILARFSTAIEVPQPGRLYDSKAHTRPICQRSLVNNLCVSSRASIFPSAFLIRTRHYACGTGCVYCISRLVDCSQKPD